MNLKPTILASICILFSIGHSQGQVTKRTLSEKEVEDFINLYDKAWQQRDTLLLKGMMGEGYKYFSSKGQVSGKSSMLAWFTPSNNYKVDNSNRSELQVEITGNVAVVGSRWQGSGTFGETKFTDDQRCSLVIAKQHDKLLLLSEHCTQITR